MEGLECRSDVVSDASAGDNPGQYILDTLHAGYILPGSTVDDEFGVIKSEPNPRLCSGACRIKHDPNVTVKNGTEQLCTV